MKFHNAYFINGTAYAGKSTMVKLLAHKYDGIACEENYHDIRAAELDKNEFPNLTYTRDLTDWSEFIRRTPDEYEAWIERCIRGCTILEMEILEELSREKYNAFLNAGFPVILRDERRSIDETLQMAEEVFRLK